MKPKTHVAIIMDRSGSMAATRNAVVGGYNEQVEQLQADAKEQDIKVSLITFNGHVYEHFWDEDADKLTKSSYEDYQPAGSTALYDALGYVIDKMQKTASEEDAAYLIITITDGEENASQQYNNSEILKKKIESLQNDKNWTFTFMGCNKESLFHLAEITSVPMGNCALWDNSSAMKSLSGMVESKKSMKGYFQNRNKGETHMNMYYSQQVNEMGDFVNLECDVDAIQDPSIKLAAQAWNTGADPNMIPQTGGVVQSIPTAGTPRSYMAGAGVNGVFSTSAPVNLNQYYSA